MRFPSQFIQATTEFSTFERPVPAPYLRRSFRVTAPTTAQLVICGLGFYELYLNGERCTKGRLAPYISNPDHMVYYDSYELPLTAGENVLGLWLGNGLQNNPGGHIWNFEKGEFRGAPRVALELTYTDNGALCRIVSDEQFRTAPSPIVMDDYRFGEHYDARKEIPGWNLPGFDDSGWSCALTAPAPKGEKRLCEAEPIVAVREIQPVSIVKEPSGWRYDFGENVAGVCRLTVQGTAGQRVELCHGEVLKDGCLDIRNIWFMQQWERDSKLVHRDVYVCRGEGVETYTPTFTYHGFQYVLVTGITEEQATPELLTYVVMNSDLRERGGFCCSDETVNALQTMTRRSSLANFYYFPTDCPHREKNGWTADAALSCEHMLLNLNPERSYREWMRNVYKTLDEHGALPGIIPTQNWGYGWGNGPAWDCVLMYIPYFVYLYRGDISIAAEAAPSMLRYLRYLTTREDENGLLHVGLGDWCQPGVIEERFSAPLSLTDTVVAKDIADKAAVLFGVLGQKEEQAFAEALSVRYRANVRRHLMDPSTLVMAGACQTSQAMALFYGIFEPEEEAAAFERLLTFIEEKDGHIDTGVLGGRVIFHVLTAFGRSDLAFHMIVRPEAPSYGSWVAWGFSTLLEVFTPDSSSLASCNHHFWGDISSWFIRALAGIRLNPGVHNVNEVEIRPSFVPQLTRAEGFHTAPAGRIRSAWVRDGEGICLSLELPAAVTGRIALEPGYVFEDDTAEKPAVSGDYRIFQK